MQFRVSLLLLTAFALTSLSAEDRYCFENDGLKYKDTVRFRVKANRIFKGHFIRSAYDGSGEKEMKFTGTKTGTVLTIEPKGKIIYEKAKGEDIILWSLKKQVLSIPLYGKNHTTGKYSNYDATFVKCKP